MSDAPCILKASAAELALLATFANMARLRWEQFVVQLERGSAASDELKDLVDDISTCVVDLDNHRKASMTATEFVIKKADYEATHIALMQTISRLAARACHASIAGGTDCENTVIPSKDMLALYCVCVCGLACRDCYIEALKLAVGFCKDRPIDSLVRNSYVHTESLMLNSIALLVDSIPDAWASNTKKCSRIRNRPVKPGGEHQCVQTRPPNLGVSWART